MRRQTGHPTVGFAHFGAPRPFSDRSDRLTSSSVEPSAGTTVFTSRVYVFIGLLIARTTSAGRAAARANECLRSRVSGDGVDVGLFLVLGGKKILRICCTPLAVGWLLCFGWDIELVPRVRRSENP